VQGVHLFEANRRSAARHGRTNSFTLSRLASSDEGAFTVNVPAPSGCISDGTPAGATTNYSAPGMMNEPSRGTGWEWIGSAREEGSLARPKTRTNPSARTKKAAMSVASLGEESSPVKAAGWPEVLTLAEAAAYLPVPEAERGQIVGAQGLPGRRIGSEWRFSRAAIQDWLRKPSMKESLLRLAGSWRDAPDVDEMLAEIYQRSGRPMTQQGE
jgi:excisionase family DNA binding protein